MSAQSALSILREIEEQNVASRALLDNKGLVSAEWRGLAFKVGDTELMTPIGDVFEILDPLKCTRVPKSKNWFNGVANIRGNLIPVMDLYCFLFGMSLPYSNNTRMLVFRHTNSLAGVIVTAVLGLRQFYQSELVNQAPEGISENFTPFVTKCFRRADQELGVFDFSSLANNETFLHVSELRE